MELVETEAPCVRNRHDPWAQLLSQWVSPPSLPFPPRPRLSSAAAARGLLPSAAPTTSEAGRPDLGGVGVNSPPGVQVTPLPTTLRCIWGELVSVCGVGRVGGSSCWPEVFTSARHGWWLSGWPGREGGQRQCGQLKPGLEPAAEGRGGAGQSRGGGGHNGRGFRRAAGRGRPPRAKSSRSSREAPTCNSSSSKTPRSLMLRGRDPLPRLTLAEGAWLATSPSAPHSTPVKEQRYG